MKAKIILIGIMSALVFTVLSSNVHAQFSNQEFLDMINQIWNNGAGKDIAVFNQCDQGDQQACVEHEERLEQARQQAAWARLWDQTIGWSQRQDVRRRKQELRHHWATSNREAAMNAYSSAQQYEQAAQNAASAGDWMTALNYTLKAQSYYDQYEQYRNR